MESFAGKHSFAIKVSGTKPVLSGTFVQLTRRDVMMQMVDSTNSGAYRLTVFEKQSGEHGLEDIDALVEELKIAITGIPNWIFHDTELP